VSQELSRAARRISPDQDRAAVTMLVRQLRQRGIQDGDVVGGGVAAGVPAPQRRGEEFAGVVAEREQRVVAERALVLCTR
jgi:hypothetical protein